MTIDANRSQRELLAVISTANPHRVTEAADRWARLSRIADEVAAHVTQRLDQLTSKDGGWTGAASDAYKARVTKDLIRPIRKFSENAAYIAAELQRLASQLGFAVNSALGNPVPWDQETNWRVEQKKVDRGWFSYVDEFFTGADEAWEDAQSNAPYQIKTGPGRVLKEIPKPAWQTTVSAVGSPSVPPVYQASGVPVSYDVNRFDRLMEYQAMNAPQLQTLITRVEGVNQTMGDFLPKASDGSVGGAPEDTSDRLGPADSKNPGTGSGSSGTGSVPRTGTGTGSPATGSTGTPGSVGSSSGTAGTGTTGDLSGIRASGGPALGTGASGTSMGSVGTLGSGSLGSGSLGSGSLGSGSLGSGSLGSGSLGSGSLGSGSLGTGSSGSGGIVGTRMPSGGAGGAAGLGSGANLGRVGTGAAGMGGMGMMPPMGAGAGGGSQGSRSNRTVGAGGSSFGSTGTTGAGGQTGTVGTLGTTATGSNASFTMGQAGRGTVSPGSVGPVGNAQVNVGGAGGGQGGGMMPMGAKGAGQRTQDDDSEFEEMYLDEDRSVWSDDISAPPGHIR